VFRIDLQKVQVLNNIVDLYKKLVHYVPPPKAKQNDKAPEVLVKPVPKKSMSKTSSFKGSRTSTLMPPPQKRSVGESGPNSFSTSAVGSDTVSPGAMLFDDSQDLLFGNPLTSGKSSDTSACSHSPHDKSSSPSSNSSPSLWPQGALTSDRSLVDSSPEAAEKDLGTIVTELQLLEVLLKKIDSECLQEMGYVPVSECGSVAQDNEAPHALEADDAVDGLAALNQTCLERADASTQDHVPRHRDAALSAAATLAGLAAAGVAVTIARIQGPEPVGDIFAPECLTWIKEAHCSSEPLPSGESPPAAQDGANEQPRLTVVTCATNVAPVSEPKGLVEHQPDDMQVLPTTDAPTYRKLTTPNNTGPRGKRTPASTSTASSFTPGPPSGASLRQSPEACKRPLEMPEARQLFPASSRTSKARRLLGNNGPQVRQGYPPPSKPSNATSAVAKGIGNTPSVRTRSSKCVVVCCQLTKEQQALVKDCTKRFGGRVLHEFQGNATHLIVDKSRTRRTGGFALALAAGAWVVTLDWVRDSSAHGMWLPEGPFEVQADQTCPVEHRGGPQRSRMAKQQGVKLLAKHCILFYGDFVQATCLSLTELEKVVTICGGKVLCHAHFWEKLAGKKSKSKDKILVVVPQSTEVASAQDLGVGQVTTLEWLLDSVCWHRLQDFESYA